MIKQIDRRADSTPNNRLRKMLDLEQLTKEDKERFPEQFPRTKLLGIDQTKQRLRGQVLHIRKQYGMTKREMEEEMGDWGTRSESRINQTVNEIINLHIQNGTLGKITREIVQFKLMNIKNINRIKKLCSKIKDRILRKVNFTLEVNRTMLYSVEYALMIYSWFFKDD